MANPWRGEVEIVVNGERVLARLTLGALAELEADLGTGSITELVTRFEGEGLRANDILALLTVSLRAGGWQGTASDLHNAEIEGGLVEAARVSAQLLALAFRPVP